MVVFLNNAIKKFNKLVINYFITTYRLNRGCLNIEENNKEKGNDDQSRYIYIYKNSFIINNKFLNMQYDSDLDETKYSLVYILYKNINYKDTNTYKSCYLDIETKKQIYDNFNNLIIDKRLNISDEVIVIGRKYVNKNKIDKIYNSLATFCIHKVTSKVLKNKNKKIEKKVDNKIVECDYIVKNIYRRNFLFNLKLEFENENILCINKILKNSLFLDVEYINDIYDDFRTFPISHDSTLLFMIGFAYTNKINNDLTYVNYTVNKLTKNEEYDILNRFVNDIIKKYNAMNVINETNKPVIIFHWSNADKIIIEKSLKRHPDLYKKYIDNVEIKYIDLLLIVKKTMYLESYSLKYVVKKLLNITYDTDCKNGFDAMCSIIQNNCRLEKVNKSLNKTLNDFASTKDIIKYNKIDTELLYTLIKKIIY